MVKFSRPGEKVLYRGKSFEIVSQKLKTNDKVIGLEIARRSPGVRLIIIKGKKILLTREYRYELKGYDYRLPGGKVFDSLKDYEIALKTESNILKHATNAAKKECLEETGLIAKNIRHFHSSKAGLTVEWDLFYFIVDDFTKYKGGQQLGHGEEIYPVWATFKEALKLCLNAKVQEDRSVGILLRFLLNPKNQI